MLAARWDLLWDGPPWVLPISFGRIDNQTDAVIALLLDHALRKRLNVPARTRGDALLALGIPHTSDDTWPDALDPIEQQLRDPSVESAKAALGQLRDIPRQLGGRRVRALQDPRKEQKALTRLQRLAHRVTHGGPYTTGLSVHQAKGKEWDRVAVRLTEEHLAALEAGLTLETETHRMLYVALTRGRHVTGQIPSNSDIDSSQSVLA